MTGNSVYYHYTFEPKKLKEQRVEVEKVFKNADQIMAKQLSRNKLPRLLEMIRQVSLDELENFANQLKKLEVFVLLYDYPYPNESQDTRRKINLILSFRYSIQVGKTAWGLFQQDPHDRYLQDLLRLIYNKDQFEFLSSDDYIKELIRKALVHRTGIVDGLSMGILASNSTVRMLMDVLQIKQDSFLEKALMKGILKEGLKENAFVHRQGSHYIVQRLDRYDMDEYKELIGVYLETKGYKDFDHILMNQAIKRLMNPNDNLMHWDFLSSNAMVQVQKWLLQNKMKQFFDQDEDNARFEYWKGYLNNDYIQDVDVIKEPKVAFIHFEKFVVVEFGIIGAAYFYHKDGFDHVIKPISNSYKFRNSGRAKREELLKRRYEEEDGYPLFINKHDHRGSWEWRFTSHMRNYLDGRF